MLKLSLLTFGLGPLAFLAAEGTPDLATALTSFGVAAPFAILAYMGQRKAEARSDRFELVIENKDKRIADMAAAAVQRERELSNQLTPLLFNSAQLYRQGNEVVQTTLEEKVEDLIRRLQS